MASSAVLGIIVLALILVVAGIGGYLVSTPDPRGAVKRTVRARKASAERFAAAADDPRCAGYEL